MAADEYDSLVSDVRDIIMRQAIEDDEIWAVMFACTCKTEFRRYLRLRVNTEISFRSVRIADATADFVFDIRNGIYLFPGEKGYDYWKKRELDNYKKIGRNTFMFRETRTRKRKEKRLLAKEWKKGNYEDF